MDSRLRQIRKELELTQKEIAEVLGCSKNNISMIETGKSTLTERNEKMLVKFLNINPAFLKTGSGPVRLESVWGDVWTTEGIDLPRVPLYNLGKTGGLFQLLSAPTTARPTGFISIPNLPECDGAAYYVGEGMHPILRSGDIVLYSALSDVSEIFWGEMYLVSVATGSGDYVSVCYLDRSSDPSRAVMRGASPERSETEIEIARINAIAMVKATIRFNTAK